MLSNTSTNALSKQLKKKQKESKLNYLKYINLQLSNSSKNNNGRIPHKMVHIIVSQSEEAYPQISGNVINKSYRKFLFDEQAKIAASERNNASNMMNNLLDEYLEEVAGIMMTLLPVLNITELEEEEETNDRPKGGRPKNTTSKKAGI